MKNKKSKVLYVPMRLHKAETNIGNLKLPDRCAGLMFAFETQKAARDFMGKDCKIQRFEQEVK